MTRKPLSSVQIVKHCLCKPILTTSLGNVILDAFINYSLILSISAIGIYLVTSSVCINICNNRRLIGC